MKIIFSVNWLCQMMLCMTQFCELHQFGDFTNNIPNNTSLGRNATENCRNEMLLSISPNIFMCAATQYAPTSPATRYATRYGIRTEWRTGVAPKGGAHTLQKHTGPTQLAGLRRFRA